MNPMNGDAVLASLHRSTCRDAGNVSTFRSHYVHTNRNVMDYVRVTVRIGSDSGKLEMDVPGFAHNLSRAYGGCTVLKGTGYWQDEQDRTDKEPSYTVSVVVPRDAVEDIKESVKVTFRGLQDCDHVMMEVEPVHVTFIDCR